MHRKFVTALVAMLISSAIVCASAFAEYEGGQWALNEVILKETIAVKFKSTTNIKFEDTKEGAVECKVSGERKVGAEGKGEVTAMTASECKPVKSCEAGTITVKAIHLPWKTQLNPPENTTDRETVSNGGTGAPGWDLECKVFGIKVNDECTGETSEKTETVTGGVDATFDSESAHVSCSIGGAATGVVAGTGIEENPTGHELQVQYIRMEGSNVSGTGEAEGTGTTTCKFVRAGQNCSIVVKNAEPGGFEAHIDNVSIIAPAGRYKLKPVTGECKAMVMLFGTETCSAKVETETYMSLWSNAFSVQVKKGQLTGVAVIRLTTS